MREQTNNFFGKLLMWTTFIGVAFVRSTKDLEQYKELLKEARAASRGAESHSLHVLTVCALLPQATFYDKQWSATWEGVDRPSEKEK